jgi:hypothetical protein
MDSSSLQSMVAAVDSRILDFLHSNQAHHHAQGELPPLPTHVAVDVPLRPTGQPLGPGLSSGVKSFSCCFVFQKIAKTCKNNIFTILS